VAEDNNDWRASLPLDIRTNDSLSRFQDVGSLAKSYLDMERFVSSTGRVPKETDNQDNWNSYYKHWGRPEKSNDYKYPDVPAEYNLNEEFKGQISGMAHELGLNQKQFDKLIKWGVDTSKGIYDRNAMQLNGQTDALKKKWGWSAESNFERARRTIATLSGMKADHPFIQWLESTGNDQNPVVIEFFYDLSKQLGEDQFVDEETRAQQTEAASAQRRINEIMSDLKGPYWNENDPRHNDMVTEVAKLYQTMTPE
jgi:hypothetical protein